MSQLFAKDKLTGQMRRAMRAELRRAGVTHAELARRLRARGLNETRASVTSKIARSTYPATFFFAALDAIGCNPADFGKPLTMGAGHAA